MNNAEDPSYEFATTETPKPECLGTRQVKLEQTNSPSVVAVFDHVDPQNHDSHFVEVFLTDGKFTFKTRIDPDETRVKWDKIEKNELEIPEGSLDSKSKVRRLASYILHDHETITITYESTESVQDTTAIKMRITETMHPNNLSNLVPWHGELKQTKPELGALVFAQMVGDSVNHKMDEIDVLQKQMSDLWEWKDTADKLTGELQKEKDVMLHRFLILYKKTHGELRKAVEQVDELKKRPPRAAVAAGGPFRLDANPAPNFAAALPADAMYDDPEMIRKLARGEDVHDPGAGASAEQASSGGGSQSACYGTTRRNPITGAIETWGVGGEDEEAKEDSGSDEPNKKQPRYESEDV